MNSECLHCTVSILGEGMAGALFRLTFDDEESKRDTLHVNGYLTVDFFLRPPGRSTLTAFIACG